MDQAAKIIAALQRALAELDVLDIVPTLEHPAELAHGDWATSVALAASKVAKKSPRALADEIVKKLGEIDGVVEVTIAGPGFINFSLSRKFFADSLADINAIGTEWGKNAHFKNQIWVVEHTSPNPNKAMHIGHLRNNVVGMAFTRLLRFSGATVTTDAIDNNRGIAIAKLMWGYLKFARKDVKTDLNLEYWFDHQDEWQTPNDREQRPDRFVDELYVLGSQDFEEHKDVEAQVRDLVVRWEAEDEKVWALWKLVLDYSYEGQRMTLERLGNEWQHVWHEHEHYREGKQYVQSGLEKGIFKKLDDGAIITSLETLGLSDTVLQKSDGTALYITQDIALTKLKKEKYKADHLVWVIGPEQSLAMQQLFAVCEQLGIGKRDEFLHLPYGYMSIKGVGKMSSRKGTVLYIDDVLDSTKEKVQEILQERELDDAEKDALAEDVALAAVKYSILRAGRLRDIEYDREESTRLDGDSGPYLQYSHTRALSVLSKASGEKLQASTAMVPDALSDLERVLYRFPEVVERAASEYEPHYVTTYLTELAAMFNSWYAKEKIVDAKDPHSPYKLALTQAFATTMKNGLWLLGIKAPERM